MAERSTASGLMLGGQSDRRQFLTSVAALTAGGVLARGNEARAQAPAGRPRRVDFHHHYQSPG